MVIPEFPQFKDVDISCKEAVNNFISRKPLEASEYTFTNIFAFRLAYNFKVSILKNNLLILKNAEPVSLFCPIGTSQIPDVLEEIFAYLKNNNIEPCLERVPDSFVHNYLRADKGFVLEEDRDQFDYVYDVRELIELKGNKFHDKKKPDK